MKKALAKHNDDTLYLIVANYENNGRLYLGITNQIDDIYCDITINLPECNEVDRNYIFLTDDISDGMKEFLHEKKIISDTLFLQPYNHSQYEMVKVDFDILKEYDPVGFEQFNEYYDKLHPKKPPKEVGK